MRGALHSLAVAVLIGGTIAPACASFGAGVELLVAIPPLQRLEIVNALQNAPPPTGYDFREGFIEPDAPVILHVYSNVSWRLLARAVPAAGDGGSLLSYGEITCLAGDDGWETLDDGWTPVAAGEPAAGREVRVRIRIPLSWERTLPGTYAPDIEYRLTSAPE